MKLNPYYSIVSLSLLHNVLGELEDFRDTLVVESSSTTIGLQDFQRCTENYDPDTCDIKYATKHKNYEEPEASDDLGMAMAAAGVNVGKALGDSSAYKQSYKEGVWTNSIQNWDGVACGIAGNWHQDQRRTEYDGDRFQLRKKREAAGVPCEDAQSCDDDFRARIIGGQDTQDKSWPWQVWLSLFGGPYGSSLCGGSIISPKWVLTAAHCAPKPGIYGTALMGASNRLMLEGEMVRINKIYPHEEYNKAQTFAMDFALVELKTTRGSDNPMTWDTSTNTAINYKRENIDQFRPVCLPTQDTCLKAYNQEVNDCWVTGWGLQHEMDSAAADHMSEVDVQIMSKRDCNGNDGIGQAGFYKTSYIHTDSMFCAGWKDGGKDACSGDSGGPLVCRVEGRDNFQIYGVVSWGQGCGRSGRPGVYGRVTHILPWIKEKTGVEPPGRQVTEERSQHCYHEPVDGEHLLDTQQAEQSAEPGEEVDLTGKFPIGRPPILADWFELPVGNESAHKIKAHSCEYSSPEGRNQGKFFSFTVFGNQYKKKYPRSQNCLWQFGHNSPMTETNLKEGAEPTCKVVVGKTMLATSRRTKCGSSDFMEVMDGNGKMVKKFCVSRKATSITVRCPIYVNFVSNNDNKVGRPVYLFWKAMEGGNTNCGLRPEYVVTSDKWTYNIGTKDYWKMNKKLNSGRNGQVQIPERTVCGTVIRADRNHWIECDTNKGWNKHGYNVPRSVNCEGSSVGFFDGMKGSEGVVKSVVCGSNNSQRTVFRSSGNSMSIVLKIGQMKSEYTARNSKIFGGFNVRCRAVRWATWFGASSDQCSGTDKESCLNGNTGETVTRSSSCPDPDSAHAEIAFSMMGQQEKCDCLFQHGKNTEECLDYMPADSM